MMKEEQFKILLDEIRHIGRDVKLVRDGIDRIDRDMAADRLLFDDWKNQLGGVKESVSAMSQILTKLQVKFRDAVQDATAEVMQPVSDQMDTLLKKPVIRIPVKKFYIKDWATNLWSKFKLGGEK